MRKNKKELWTNFFMWSFISAVIGIIVCMVVLFMFSFILYNFTEVINSYSVFSISSLVSGAFVNGFICGIFRRNKGLYEGAVSGFIMYVLLVAIGGVLFSSFNGILSIKKLLLCVIISAVGGVIGVNQKRPKRI